MRSFRDFMIERVRAYYASPKEKFSALGDFFTAPELDRAFGEAVASFLLPYIKEFERPVLLELGAGRGLMAKDILSYIRSTAGDVFGRLTYLIYEVSPYLREVQKKLLSRFSNVEWVDRIPPMEGIVLSNEFFDTLPVHVVEGERELYINGEGEEVWLELRDERVREYIERMGWTGVKQRVEVCLDCVDLLKDIADSLRKGWHLVIDYGYTAEEVSKFPSGTVVGYKKHRLERDILKAENVDISAYVNFTALMEYGRDFGFETVLFMKQRDFLMSVPTFISELEALSLSQDGEAVQRLSRLKTMLISMGDRFRVLLQRRIS